MSDIIELSIAETNELRAKLGLKPLNVSHQPQPQSLVSQSNQDAPLTANGGGTTALPSQSSQTREQLELSVDETNKLRASLGLRPLNTKKEAIVHAPAENEGAKKEYHQPPPQPQML